MLSSSLNTGSTDLRDTEVQHPNTAATLSLEISSRAFSANSGQLDAGSTTTASSFLPRRPPLAFCSSISISMTSFNVVSEIAMVPDSEWRMPTLIVSSAALAGADIDRPATITPAENILVIAEKLPLMFHAPKLVVLHCNMAVQATCQTSARREVERDRSAFTVCYRIATNISCLSSWARNEKTLRIPA